MVLKAYATSTTYRITQCVLLSLFFWAVFATFEAELRQLI